ncbi:MAG TPA: hypothetical protein VMV79_06250 [Alphaproteobacteria bacterium]|nr:hypothetical protein [Alphaproteobacteria bacterium]
MIFPLDNINKEVGAFYPPYAVEEELEAVLRGVAGIRQFLSHGWAFTDRTDDYGFTTQDIVVKRLAIAVDMMPPFIPSGDDTKEYAEYRQNLAQVRAFYFGNLLWYAEEIFLLKSKEQLEHEQEKAAQDLVGRNVFQQLGAEITSGKKPNITTLAQLAETTLDMIKNQQDLLEPHIERYNRVLLAAEEARLFYDAVTAQKGLLPAKDPAGLDPYSAVVAWLGDRFGGRRPKPKVSPTTPPSL